MKLDLIFGFTSLNLIMSYTNDFEVDNQECEFIIYLADGSKASFSISSID